MYYKTKILAPFIVLGAVLVTGLVAIPVMEEADEEVTRIQNEIKENRRF
jgi:hypothetical protein